MALVARAELTVARTRDMASSRIGIEIEERTKNIAHLEAVLGKRTQELSKLRDEVSILDINNEELAQRLQPIDVYRNITDIAPEDAYDLIARREAIVKLEERRKASLKKSVHDLPLVNSYKTKELEVATHHLQYITDVTGWTPQRKPMDPITFEKTMRDITEMELLINRLEDEKKTNVLIQRKKEQLLQTLNMEMERKKELYETLLTMNNSIRVADREVREIRLQLENSKAAHTNTDTALIAVESSRDLVVFSSLEMDIKFLEGEVEKHQMTIKEQQRLMRSQQYRLEQLESRVNVVMLAAQDLGLEKDIHISLRGAMTPVTSMTVDDITSEVILPSNEAIDVELFELLQRDLSELRNASSMKDILTLEKGATLEALARKLEILMASKKIEVGVYEQEKHEQDYQIMQLREQLEDQQQQWLSELEGPTKERLRMQKNLAKAINTPSGPGRHLAEVRVQ